MADLNTSLQFASTPLPSDLPFYNYGAATIAVGAALSPDSVNTMDGTIGNDGPGVVVAPTAGNPVLIGVAMENIFGTTAYPAGGSAGRVRTQGLAVCTSNGTVTAGGGVRGDTTNAGQVNASTTGNPYLGIALTSAVAGDPILVLVMPGLYSK